MKMNQIQAQIVEKLQALVCPPDGIALTGGEQKPTGNQYPNADNIDLSRHVSGLATFALDATYTDVKGVDVSQFGAFDIDEPGEEGLAKVKMIEERLTANGISTLISFSGQKGWHLYVITEPVPKQIMVAALKKVKVGIPFQGELIPGDGRRCKIAPCLHQVSGNMSYLVGGQPYQDAFGLDDLPDGFYEGQLAILEKITPTPANVLVAFATADQEPQRQEISQDMIPKLKKDDAYTPPCISSLVENGGSPHLGRYDLCNLTLRGYTVAKGLSENESIELARKMAKNAENGLVPTGKTYAVKVRHFKSIKNAPSLEDAPFSCVYMLGGRKDLKFKCGECRVRPDGMHIRQPITDHQVVQPSKLVLERPLAIEVMSHIVQKGMPAEPIAPEIMPMNGFTSHLLKGSEIYFKAYALLLRAIGEGCVSLTQIAKWIDKGLRSFDDLAAYTQMSSNELSELCGTNNVAFVGFLAEFKNGILGLFEKLASRELVDDDNWQEMLAHTSDLTMRYRLAERSLTLHSDTLDPTKDIFTTHSEYADQSTQIVAGTQRGAVVPITTRAEHLIGHLLGGGAAKTPTPFADLNSLLGDGFVNGSLYVAVSPPGGGKTTFASQCADFAAQSGIPVIFVSMEMGIEQIFANSMARSIPMNSAKIVSPYADIKDDVQNQVAEAAEAYFEGIGKYLYIVEGTYDTTPARIQAMIHTVRAEQKLTQKAPFLVVIDYLQLLNTGNESLDTSPNETIKISELAVRCKQLARDCGVAVLAISDITKDEQQKSFASKEFTLNSLRGSNRIGHAADTVMALYSECSEADGGKATDDPWDIYVKKVSSSERAQDFVESVKRAKRDHKTGGDGAAVYARLELIKNRAGQGRGSQFLIYERAYHRFEPVTLPGQAQAEGRA